MPRGNNDLCKVVWVDLWNHTEERANSLNIVSKNPVTWTGYNFRDGCGKNTGSLPKKGAYTHAVTVLLVFTKIGTVTVPTDSTQYKIRIIPYVFHTAFNFLSPSLTFSVSECLGWGR